MEVQELRNSRDKPQVVYHNFMLSTRNNIENLFCFFEGKDNDYYVPRIKQFTKEKYLPFNCNGKKQVLDVYKLITERKEYEKYNIAFFVDKDFEKSIVKTHPKIYETPCYSIENLYVSNNVFKKIINNKFGILENEEVFNILIDLFEKRKNEFIDAICMFNAWYCCLVEYKSINNLPTIEVSLDDKLPPKIIEINIEKITKNYDLEIIYKIFKKAPKISLQSIENKMITFKNLNMEKIFRGKYQLQFLLKMLHLIIKDSYMSKKYVNTKINCSFGDISSINNQQAITIFSTEAETPECLLQYLNKVTKQKKNANKLP